MSTKIDGGFRLRNTTLEQALEMVNELRPQIAEKARDRMAKSLADRLVNRIDLVARNHADGNMIPADETTYEEVWATMMAELDEALEHGGFPMDSCKFTISLYALGDDVLGISHSFQSTWEDAWNTFSRSEDYHWQNQSDRPDHLSEAEWDQRERDWDAVYGERWWDCEMYGLKATIHDHRGPKPSIKDVFSKVPDVETRAHAAAMDKVRHQVMKEIEQQKGGKESWGFVLGPANDYLKTEEGQARVHQEAERLMEILPELTLESLQNGVEFPAPPVSQP